MNFFDPAGRITDPVLLEHMNTITEAASKAAHYMESNKSSAMEMNAVESIYSRSLSINFSLTSALVGLKDMCGDIKEI